MVVDIYPFGVLPSTMFNSLLCLFLFYSKMFKPALIGEASEKTAQGDDVSGSYSTTSHPDSHR